MKAPALVVCVEHISTYQHQWFGMLDDLEFPQVYHFFPRETNGNGAFYDTQIGLPLSPRPIKGPILTPLGVLNLQAHFLGCVKVYERPCSYCVT